MDLGYQVAVRIREENDKKAFLDSFPNQGLSMVRMEVALTGRYDSKNHLFYITGRHETALELEKRVRGNCLVEEVTIDEY